MTPTTFLRLGVGFASMGGLLASICIILGALGQ